MLSPGIREILAQEETELHAHWLSHGLRMIDAGERHWSQRYDRFREAERLLRAYRDEDTQDTRTKKSSLTSGVKKIVVPYTLAVVHARVAFLMSVLTQRQPMIPVSGMGPLDAMAAILHELILDYQINHMEPHGQLGLYQYSLDAERYGIGILKNVYTTREFPDLVRSTVPVFGPMGEVQGVESTLTRRDVVAYEGNQWTNLSPYQFLCDPHLPAARFQEGEFAADWYVRSYTHIRQKQAQGLYAGVEFIPRSKHQQGTRGMNELATRFGQSDLARIANMSEGGLGTDNLKDAVTVHELYWYADPRDLELTESLVDPADRDLIPDDTPTVWVMRIANRSRVIGLEPAILPGRRFPYEVIESWYDLHAPGNPGSAEILSGLSYHYTWLFNSRMQCFDAQTEMLTDVGWKPVASITADDMVATVDPETRELWYERPASVFAYDYTGPMVRVQSMRADLCVTPNHRVYVAKRHPSQPDGYDPEGFVLAEDLHGEYRLPIAGLRDEAGIDSGEMVFEAEPPKRDRGRVPKYPERRIPLDLWAAFLGWVVSDGSITHGTASGSYAVTVAQMKPRFIPAIDALMEALPWHVTRYEADDGKVTWTISDRRLYRWLAANMGTTAHTKCVPGVVFEWSPRLREIFLRAAVAGDGSLKGEEPMQYTSVSRELIDAIQHLAVSIGWMAYGGLRNGTVTPTYTLNLSTEIRDHSFQTSRNVMTESYAGQVYCVENSTHLVVVRRNGKACITGQSVRRTNNNQLVIDPSMVEEADLTSDDPGLLIRLKRQFWQAGATRDAVFPLPTQDVTQSHIGVDAPAVRELMDTVSGNNFLLGQSNSGRRSATEVQGQLQSLSARMKMVSQLQIRQGIVPLVLQMIKNNQTFLDAQTLGLQAPYDTLFGQPIIQVTPDMLQGTFTIPLGELGIPADQQLEASMLKELLMQGMQTGAAAGAFANVSWEAIFARFLWRSGIKDLSTFGLSMQNLSALGFPGGGVSVQPDQQVMEQAQAGNVVPDQGGFSPMGSDGFSIFSPDAAPMNGNHALQ